MFPPVRPAPPAALLTAADVKPHLKEDAADRDAEIAALIAAAVEHLDGYSGTLGRALVTQTWRQDFTGFCDRMALPLAPVQSITTIQYYDANDQQQTLSSDVYRLLTDALGPYVARVPDQSWPSVGERDAPVSITFVAGYGAPSAVPAGLVHAAILHVQRLYDPLSPQDLERNQRCYDALIAPYRRLGV